MTRIQVTRIQMTGTDDSDRGDGDVGVGGWQFLVDRGGQAVAQFPPQTDPLAIEVRGS